MLYGAAEFSRDLDLALLPDPANLHRLEAAVFGWNLASARVLEKAGYSLEGRLRRSVIKDGRIADSLLYARLRELPTVVVR